MKSFMFKLFTAFLTVGTAFCSDDGGAGPADEKRFEYGIAGARSICSLLVQDLAAIERGCRVLGAPADRFDRIYPHRLINGVPVPIRDVLLLSTEQRDVIKKLDTLLKRAQTIFLRDYSARIFAQDAESVEQAEAIEESVAFLSCIENFCSLREFTPDQGVLFKARRLIQPYNRFVKMITSGLDGVCEERVVDLPSLIDFLGSATASQLRATRVLVIEGEPLDVVFAGDDQADAADTDSDGQESVSVGEQSAASVVSDDQSGAAGADSDGQESVSDGEQPAASVVSVDQADAAGADGDGQENVSDGEQSAASVDSAEVSPVVSDHRSSFDAAVVPSLSAAFGVAILIYRALFAGGRSGR